MQKYYREARLLLSLAIPVAIAQIAQTAMGVVDTVMAGGYSATDMSAVAVGTSIWLPTIWLAHGLLLAMTPIISQYNGSNQRANIPHIVSQGMALAILLSVLVMLILYFSKYIFLSMHNIDPELANKAIGYIHAMMWGAPGYLLFQTLRSFCDGLSKTKPGMVIGLLGLLINIPINYIFIYGKLGLPAMGGVGCGIATAFVNWAMFFLIKNYIQHSTSLKDIVPFIKIERLCWLTLKRFINIGLPVALAIFCEITLFTIVTLFITPLGVVAIAGHQIALNFSSLVFVLPLSLGIAATIRIGYRLGTGSIQDSKISAYTILMIGFLLSIVTASLTIVLRKQIALLYNDEVLVVMMAANLMFFAAVYQFSDTIQVIGAGILRGYKDTHSIFIITFFSYWLLGLPIGYLLGLTNILVPAMGPSGFWIGFIIGLTSSAILLMLRMRWLQKQSPDFILQRAAK